VLPVSSRTRTNRSSGTAQRSATAWRMRRFAWCGDEAIDVAQCQPSGRDDLLADIGHAAHGRAEDVLPEHVHLVAPCGEAPARSPAPRFRLPGSRAPAARAPSLWMRHASIPRGSPGSARSTSTAPAPSPNRTAVVRSDQSMMRLSSSTPTTSTRRAPARSDELVRDGQPEQEARARRADVEGGNLACAQLVLESHRARRHRAVGGDRRRDDHVERRSAHAGGLERAA
jgi:hypothetical protein